MVLPASYFSNNYELLPRFIDFLLHHNFCCGISSEFCDLRQVSVYKAQAQFALEKACDNKVYFVYYDACQWEQIVETTKEHMALQAICHPSIYTLWNAGKESDKELVRCFSAYLLNGRNIAETSRKLHLHRNTLIYRLDKISGILNTDIDTLSDEELFYYLFSCMAVQKA